MPFLTAHDHGPTMSRSAERSHLVDIENLMVTRWRAPSEWSRQWSDTGTSPVSKVRTTSSLAWNHRLGAEVKFRWPEIRLVGGRGVDGADRALLETVNDFDWTASRFDRVVIGSGDGIFVQVVDTYRAVGIVVGVVARPSSIRFLRSRAFLPSIVARLHGT